MCQGRAVADGRMVAGRFSDPIAARLLRPDELTIVAALRTGIPPAGWRDGIEHRLVATAAGVAAARTIAIDEAIREHPTSQVVILGAGLDGRAWRMPELGAADVFEVDHPASQADKRDRAAGLPPMARGVRFVAVDFGRDDLGDRLAASGHDAATPTTWVWEGVIPYLTRPDVAATLRVVAHRSAPGSRLILTHVTPTHTLGLGRLLARIVHRIAGRSNPFATEPLRSFWAPGDMRHLIGQHGFTVGAVRSLLEVGDEPAGEMRRRRALGHGRVVVADR